MSDRPHLQTHYSVNVMFSPKTYHQDRYRSVQTLCTDEVLPRQHSPRELSPAQLRFDRNAFAWAKVKRFDDSYYCGLKLFTLMIKCCSLSHLKP